MSDKCLASMRHLGTIAALSFLSAAMAFCQTQGGNILGTLTDQSGAVVRNGVLVLSNPSTGEERTVHSGADGEYRFSLVPLGTYALTAEANGFKKYVNNGVNLAANQTLRIDIKLELGPTTQQVSVSATSVGVTTDTPEIAYTRNQAMINSSPNGMDIPTSVSSQMNIASTSGLNGNSLAFSFYGGGLSDVTTTKDGVVYGLYNHYIYSQSVQEVQTEALLAPAKYETPATINVVTKQGTNDFHGSIDATLYNGLFDAEDTPRAHEPLCSSLRPCTTYWWGGLSVGGPVYLPKVYNGRDKTFFTFSMDRGKNNNAATTTTEAVPDAALRLGNLSSLPGTATNPATGSPFAGDIIPTREINPVAQKLLAYYPPPDVPGGNTATIIRQTPNNFIRTLAVRLDQKITDNSWLNFSWSNYDQAFDYNFAGSTALGYIGLENGTWNTNVYSWGNTQVFSPTIVNEARFGIDHEGPTGFSATTNAATTIKSLGLTDVPAPNSNVVVAGPNITVPGFTPFIGFSSSANDDNVYSAFDNLSLQKGSHTIQLGIDVGFSSINHDDVSPGIYPQYAFDGRFSGVSFADFLLGLPATITRTDARPEVQDRRRSVGLYIQDDWRVSPRFTLNIGVRYDYLWPEYEAGQLQYNFDINNGDVVVPTSTAIQRIDPAWPLASDPVITAQQAGFPSNLTRPDDRNLFPRIGFAWRPFGQDTVLRAGYGIYVVPDSQSGSGSLAPCANCLVQTGGPFQLTTVFQNGLNGQPLVQWPVGYPTTAVAFNGLPVVTGVNPNLRYPYDQQWNFTIEHAFGGQVLRISYIGTKDTDLTWMRDLNTPPASTTPFNPANRRFPNYTSVYYIDSGVNADYNGLESELTFRQFHGLVGSVGYSWAKQMSDSGNTYDSWAGSMPQDPYCLRCDYARTNQVPSQRMLFSLIWTVPFGRGQQFGSSARPWVNALLGGWQVSDDFRANTGQYYSPEFVGADPTNTNTFGGRPEVIGNWKVPSGEQSPDHWYNQNAFAIPPAGSYGDAGRNTIEGPGFASMDLGLFKTFPITERLKLLVSATAQNALNHANYMGIGNAINVPNPGFISSYAGSVSTYAYFAGPMRVVKFDLGIQF